MSQRTVVRASTEASIVAIGFCGSTRQSGRNSPGHDPAKHRIKEMKSFCQRSTVLCCVLVFCQDLSIFRNCRRSVVSFFLGTTRHSFAFPAPDAPCEHTS